MQDFKKLKVWQKAHQLAVTLYRETGLFPRSEIFGLTNQIRRSSVSVGSNIAEGCGRGGTTEFARFITIAQGSVGELESQLLLARDLGFLSESRHKQFDGELAEIRKMLTSLSQKIKK